jgi:hypothetical protein
MTQKAYYLFALTMPFWLPLVSFPLSRFQFLYGWVVLLFLSLLYGGIPYLLLLIGVLAWSRNQTGASLQRAVFVLPLLFALWLPSSLIAFFSVLEFLTGQPQPDKQSFWFFAPFALGFGYVYVAIAVSSFKLLKRCGFVHNDSIDQAPFISLNL